MEWNPGRRYDVACDLKVAERQTVLSGMSFLSSTYNVSLVCFEEQTSVLSTCTACNLHNSGVLQLLGKSYLHYALLPGQAVPEWLSVLQQQPPRHSSPPAGRAEFALYSFTMHMAYVPKQVINAQVCDLIPPCWRPVR